MNTTLPKIISFFIAVLTVILLVYKYPTNAWAVLVVGLLANIIASPVAFYIVSMLDNIKQLPILFKTKVLLKNKDVRISISYLFRIKVKDHYLLVKNRTGNYYQLVGGAYKRYESSENVFKKYQIKSDRQFHTDHGIAKNDLRFRVPGKYVLDILKWFKSKEDRESSQWREFCEELLSTNILCKTTFRYIDYTYAGTLQTPIQKAKYLDCQEILIYEIYDLLPNEEQRKVLEELSDRGNTEQVKWAPEPLINSLGFDEYKKEKEFEIGAHTKWAIQLKYTNE